jgi:DNA-binding protein WhiA
MSFSSEVKQTLRKAKPPHSVEADKLRGFFVACGSVTDPKKAYHLEFNPPDAAAAEEIRALLAGQGITAHASVRKNASAPCVYIKDGQAVADALTLLGAPVQALAVIDMITQHELSRSINRKSNCDVANIDRMTTAAVRQTTAIRRIEETSGLSALPDDLRQIADARLNNPYASLDELAKQLGISRSGVNRRLGKLVDLSAQEQNPGD